MINETINIMIAMVTKISDRLTLSIMTPNTFQLQSLIFLLYIEFKFSYVNETY